MQCPKCNTAQSDDNISCTMCGIVFSRYNQNQQNEPPLPEDTVGTYSNPIPEAPVTSAKEIAVCFSIALAVQLVAFLALNTQSIGGFVLRLPSMAFKYLAVLVHELGHTIFAWLYGYPAIPAFDFMYGGGVTIWQERKMGLAIFIILVFAGIIGWAIYRRKRRLAIGVGIVLFIHLVLTFTSSHNAVILYMGHGTELILAAIFIYRFISGTAIIAPLEKPLYGIIGFFMVNNMISFAFQLIFSNSFRDQYHNAKGGGHWMDFDRIANEFFHTPLGFVAALFLACCLITPIIPFLFHRYHHRVSEVAHYLTESQ